MKTVQQDNIGDFTNSIFVGENQNSYKGNMIVKKEERPYNPALPTFYNKGKENQKICLTYFITILYKRENLDIMVIAIDCMPNGELEKYYKTRVLKAGKNLVFNSNDNSYYYNGSWAFNNDKAYPTVFDGK